MLAEWKDRTVVVQLTLVVAAISSSGLSLDVEDCTFSECYVYAYGNAGCGSTTTNSFGGAIRATGETIL